MNKSINTELERMLSAAPPEVRMAGCWSYSISERLEQLLAERGLSKSEFARAMGKQSSEITKWLSGKHNFTLRTLAAISTYFDTPIIKISKGEDTV